MKLCFSTLGCPDWDITQVANNGAAYGFDAVELRISGQRHIDPALTPDERKKIKALFADAGLQIACISGYTVFCGDDPTSLKQNEENLQKNIQLAADIGAPYLRTFLGENGPFTSAGAETLHRICNQAHEKNVTVLMEIHDALLDGKMANQVATQVNSPGFAIIWDIHHSLAAKESPAETWQQAGPFIRHVHMKDATAEHECCLLGKGTFPLADVVKTLKDNHFTGCLSFEWEKTWIPKLEDPEVALPHYVDYMKRLING